MKDGIDFYFDFSSPYGYLAATQIDGVAGRHGRRVTWKPILLGVVFKTTGQRALPTIPLKGEYARRDLVRSARLLGVPFQIPSRFPIACTAASRAFYWANERDPVIAKRLALALFGAYFADNRDISSPEVTIEIATDLGLERKEVVRAVRDPALKERLRDEVEQAMARGVFGSPYIIVDGEPFWGADRLDQIDRWLGANW